MTMHGHVIVVGAGPTGLSAALYLARNGVDVTVIDRMSETAYDRYHEICGAGISRKAFRKLRYIEPWHVRNRIDRGELAFPGDILVSIPVKGYVLDRVAFLHELRARCESAGCCFVHGTVIDIDTVTDLEDKERMYHVTLGHGPEYLCTHIIGCDGAHSIVRKKLFGWKPVEAIPTTECIVEGEPRPVFRMELGERWKGAYSWTFPAGDNVSIGALKGLVSTEDVISHGSRMIPFGGGGPIEKDNAYLCGDAAAMPNPICAGGLMVGLVSGQECARTILSGKRGRYQRWWDNSILSSPRFMWFHQVIVDWKDSDFEDAAEPFRGGGNFYLLGMKALLTKRQYVREYLGCLQTFRHAW